MNIIVATDLQGGIGKDNKLPWASKYPQDLKFFQMLTFGKKVIVGRKTYESMGPLLGRKLYVVSSKADDRKETPSVKWCKTFDEAYDRLLAYNHQCFIIGGQSIYEQAFALNDKYGDIIQQVYVTNIPYVYNCDAFFRCNENFVRTTTLSLGGGVRVKMYVNEYILEKHKAAHLLANMENDK